MVMTAALALAAGLAVTAATPPPSNAPSASPPTAAATQAPPASITTAPATPAPVATATASPTAPATTAPAVPTPAPKVGTPAPKVTPTTVAPTPKPTSAATKTTAKAAPKAAAKVTPKAATALVCKPATAQPSNSFPGTTVVADNFESGNLSKWAVHTGGTGTAAVVSNAWVTGACSTHLHATTASGSIATLTKAIPAGLGEVYADGYFDVQTAAPAGAANSYLRFYIGSTRIASIYRNTSGGQLWLNTLTSTGSSALFRLTSAAVTTGRWHHLQVHLLPNGTTSVLEIWLDGVRIYHTNNLDGRTGAISSVSTGNEFTGQQGDLYLDNLIIKAQSNVNCNTAVPTDTFPGTTVVADGFECGNLSKWTVNHTGDGAATVQQTTVHTGLDAASLVTSPNNLSLANLSHAIPAGSTDVYADGWFNITAIGPVGNDVPYFRFWTGSTRFADIYRYNSTGQLWLRVLTPTGTDAYSQLSKTAVTLSAWHHVQMRVAANGAATTIQVWLDGVEVYNSAAVSTSATSTTSVMLGSEHYPQPASINIDDVIVKSVP
ncbi:hypothetical protein B5P43_23360 [Bacillus sp. SRB_336]|nr:hypothetical protein B5P43_23360 [Bacillus sp. SRB_336]